MYYTNTSMPSAWIVDSRDRGRKKIYLNSKIYLENNQEFLIELFNPLQDSVLAEIKINGKNASANGLILRPGERFYLDCFIDDKKKFVFKTYEIENTTESLNATSNNGYVEVSFYKEKQYNNFNWGGSTITVSTNTYPYYTIYGNGTTCGTTFDTSGITFTNTGISNTISSGNYTLNNLSNTSTANCYYSNNANTINTSSLNLNLNSTGNSAKSYRTADKTETGRVEKGSKSGQKFESVSMDFENWCINKVSYQLLPNSKKPVETTEMKKNFCSECGHKLKGTERFCPSCGTRI